MKAKSPGTTKQKRRILLVALYVLKNIYANHRPHKQKVIAFVRDRKLMHIPPEDEDIRMAGEEVWKHDLSWQRNALRQEGLLRMPDRGTWQITEAGERDVEAWAQRIRKMSETKPNWVEDFQLHAHPEAEYDEECHYEYYITEETIRWGLKIAAMHDERGKAGSAKENSESGIAIRTLAACAP